MTERNKNAMRMYDIIMNKRNGSALSDAEIRFFVDGVTNGDIPDYQISALMMAVYFKGMDAHETACLTECMMHSGDVVDLSPIPGIKVDKHSTGGVGDKTSLIIAPIAAACGVKVAKMSGRGLGHTGGTVDKLESIPGYQTALEKERFFEIVRDVGVAIIGQTGNIAPADKKLYALRDVTATVDNISLIASSIMSKKLATGSDAILLDVKTGSGAFMKTLEDSVALAREMVSIGEHLGRKVMALITDMEVPLGFAIGNTLELREVIDSLHGNGPEDLMQVCIELAASMLLLGGLGGCTGRTETDSLENCRQLARQSIADGSAYRCFRAMVEAQGGDPEIIDHPDRFDKAPVLVKYCAKEDGFLRKIDAEKFGIASVLLGAGRMRKEDAIDFSAGIVLHCKPGQLVCAGDTIAELHTSDAQKLPAAITLLDEAITIGSDAPPPQKTIYAKITADEVEYNNNG